MAIFLDLDASGRIWTLVAIFLDLDTSGHFFGFGR